jgi:aspartokinase
MANNNCVSYLEFLSDKSKAQMDAAMAAGERPTARSKEMWMNCMKVKNGIMAACQQGALSPEDYKASLEAQLQKDKAMIKYFMATGD